MKAGNAAGYFFPEAVVCSFMWAGTHNMDVTNNSYFADPWEYNCKNDPGQRAIWKAEQRAIKFAQQQGVTVVASAGNDSDDVAHPTGTSRAPTNPPGSEQEREITNACVVIPLEMSGVIGVSATGSAFQGTDAGEYPDNLKSFYSSYGVGSGRRHGPGRRLPLRHAAVQRPGHRPGAIDVAGEPAGFVRGSGSADRRAGRPCRRLLLPAGNVDGGAARCGRRGAHRQPVRRCEDAAERQDAAEPGCRAPGADG